MGWFDEQIKERKLNDDELFSQAFVDMTGAVLGKARVASFRDSSFKAKDAIEEILKFYHIKSREIPANVKDLSDQLEYLLHPYGIMRRVVELTDGWYKNAFGAMLGRLESSGQVVALIPYGMRGYCYTDPESGKRIVINRHNARDIELEAVVFYKAFPQRALNVHDLLVYMLSLVSTADIVWIVLSAFVATIIALPATYIVNYLTGTVVTVGNMQLLVAVAVFYICMTLSKMLFGTVNNILSSRLEKKISLSVEAATMMRILSLPASFFADYSSGELNTYMSQIGESCRCIINVIFQSGLMSIFSLIYVGQIAKYAPSLVVPALVVIVSSVAVSTISAVWNMSHARREIELGAKENGLSYALIAGVQKIKLAGAEKRAFAKWARAYANASEVFYRLPAFITCNSVITNAIVLLGTIAIYSIAIANKVSMSEYFAFNIAYSMVMAAFATFEQIIISVAQIKPFLDMAKPLMDAVPEVSEGRQMITSVSGNIELDDVSFRYKEDMPYVIENLSLKIKSGEYVAIVGETGCGKSTLMRLLLGFEKPNKGAIYYDGRDINSIDLKSLRHNVGVVTQNGKLFQGDIFSNIVISKPTLNLNDAWEAAELAGLADDIRQMPMGMNTVISEGQGGISGGQKQRLMIARAIAPKPRILMLDEATSALDNITQKKVSDSLDNLKCTRIVIAHRLSTIKQCDRIIMLSGGNIVEEGTYEELIALNGQFAELVNRQRI